MRRESSGESGGRTRTRLPQPAPSPPPDDGSSTPASLEARREALFDDIRRRREAKLGTTRPGGGDPACTSPTREDKKQREKERRMRAEAVKREKAERVSSLHTKQQHALTALKQRYAAHLASKDDTIESLQKANMAQGTALSAAAVKVEELEGESRSMVGIVDVQRFAVPPLDCAGGRTRPRSPLPSLPPLPSSSRLTRCSSWS